jgi:hypothetical protein
MRGHGHASAGLQHFGHFLAVYDWRVRRDICKVLVSHLLSQGVVSLDNRYSVIPIEVAEHRVESLRLPRICVCIKSADGHTNF